jgi:hypothetical protein
MFATPIEWRGWYLGRESPGGNKENRQKLGDQNTIQARWDSRYPLTFGERGISNNDSNLMNCAYW